MTYKIIKSRQTKSFSPIVLLLNKLKIVSIVVYFTLQNLLPTQKGKHRV